MATKTITFAKGTACPAGNHYEVVILLNGTPIGTRPVEITGLRNDPPSNQEVIDALLVLMREMVERSGALTKAQARTFLDGSFITIDFPVF